MSKLNVEEVKRQSHGLRGPLAEDIAASDAFLSEAGKILIKFHGSYEQMNRDQGRQAPKEHSFMIRSKLPGGQLTAAQYLAHDHIAGEYGNGTLRVTVRQGIQFHGVLKGQLRDGIRAINHALATTFGACGDVVRNVKCCPAHTTDPRRLHVQHIASELSRATLPRTKAYHQIWIDGEALVDDEEDPLYGQAYLPRKFKAAVGFAGDNCVDIFTNDAGLIALFDKAGRLEGFNVTAGGGMGLTHNKEETFARLADVVGFVHPDHAVEVVMAIVSVHRDFGDRTNRKHARLKYVIHEWGVERFVAELRERVTFPICAPRPMPAFSVDDHLGWQAQGDGRWSLGIPIESGRITDRGDRRLRSGLRALVEEMQAPVRLTPQQNVLLVDIADRNRPSAEALMREYGIPTVERISAVERLSLACPALPTCGLALTEAERILPTARTGVEAALSDAGIPDEPIVFRITGCPNGCARPFVAELALVGRTGDKYMLYLGGNRVGTRLAEPFRDLVPLADLGATLTPIFRRFRAERLDAEGFGDFCHRVGVESLRAGEIN